MHISGDGEVTISGGSVAGNSAVEGGGLWNSPVGTLTVSDDAVIESNTAVRGGGIYQESVTDPMPTDPIALAISDTIIRGNRATGDEVTDGGGGIHNAGARVLVTSSTISGNVAGNRDRVITTSFALDGTQENPPVTTDATGTADFTYNADAGTFDLTLTVTGLDLDTDETDGASQLTMAHFHVGAVGVNGPVFVNLLDDDAFVDNGDGTLTLTITGDEFPASFVDELIAGRVYLNVHSVANPSGEVRGQIVPTVVGGMSGASGGGVFNAGQLTVTGSTISANEALRAGGGIEAIAGSTTTLTDSDLTGNSAGSSPGNGGGLHITGDGEVTLMQTDVTGNSAASEGGGLWNSSTGTLTVTGGTISGNVASGAAADNGGGGVFSDGGTTTITGTTISGNIADGASGSGGGIFFGGGTVTVDGGTISGNRANRAGGGVELIAGTVATFTDVTISGNDAGTGAATAAPGNGGGVHLSGDAVATFSGGEVSGNNAVEGGGLWNSPTGTLTVADGILIENNTAVRGGGIYQEAGDRVLGPLTQALLVTGATIRGNTATGTDATDGGGGIYNAGNAVRLGAATIADNVAGVGDASSASGGGIFNAGELFAGGTIISGNSAMRAGGGIEAIGGSTTTLLTASLTGNSVGSRPGNGGGLHITGDGEVTITSGSITGNTAASEGGGLWNSATGTLTINGQTTISGNTASGDDATNGGGGVFNDGGTLSIAGATITGNAADGTAGSGGGLLSVAGDVTLNGVTFGGTEDGAGNTANRAGGAIELIAGTLTMTSGQMVGNSAGINGGGFHSTGAAEATFSNLTATGNTAASEGGALWNSLTGTLTVNDSFITGNTASGDDATNGGGGIFNNGGSVTVAGTTIGDNVADGASGSGGGIFNAGTLTVTDSSIGGNTANRAGGGIETIGGTSVTLTRTGLVGNEVGDAPGNGGGLHAGGNAVVSIAESSITGNTATEGGGLWNSAAGTMTVTRSLVAGNSADAGGGIYNDGDGGTITLIASTISGNSATTIGGGVFSEGGTVEHTSVTIAMNTAATGGGIAVTGGTATAINTIVGLNMAGTGPDVSGTLASGGFNLIGNTAGATIASPMSTDITGVDPGLEALADNGGPTRTHALASGSPALSAGTLAGQTLDQRRFVRPQGDGPDIGAFESALNASVTGATTLAISAVNSNRVEGDAGVTNFTFVITRGGALGVTTSVDFAVMGTGSLDAADFGGTLPSGTVTFQPGQASATINIPVSGDNDVEASESFTVMLSNSTGGATISVPTAGGTIVDDDSILTNGTRLLAPPSIVRLHVIPGDGIPTAILFAAVRSTIVTVAPASNVPAGSSMIRFLADSPSGGPVPAGGNVNGVATLAVEAGRLYAIVFEPQSSDQVFSIRAEAGFNSLSTGVFTNILQPTDVNGNGETSALDALLIINRINETAGNTAQPTGGQGEGAFTTTSGGSRVYPDVTRDGQVTALDALRVINRLNAQSPTQSEPIVAASFVADTPFVAETVAAATLAPEGSAASTVSEAADTPIESFDTVAKAIAAVDDFVVEADEMSFPAEDVDSVFSESEDDELLTLLAR